MISFSCNNCGKGFRVPSDKGGKTAKCPVCGHLLQIPVSGEAPPPMAVRRTVGQSPRGPERHPRYRHISPEDHDRAKLAGRQRANLIMLGVILLIGFILPVIQDNGPGKPRSVDIANITILTQQRAPISLKVLCLAPGVAGIGLIVLQAATRHPVRGVLILFMALTPIFVSMIDFQITQAVVPGAASVQHENTLAMTLGFMGIFIAPLAMLTGARARSYRPDSMTAYCFGIAGAVLWLLFLITPSLPSEQGSIFLMMPFELLKHDATTKMGMGLIALAASMTLAAAVCIINAPSTDPGRARKHAALAFRAMCVGVGVFLLFLGGMFMTSFPAIVAGLKALCWFGGMHLLLPTGATDLIVGHIHHHHHEHSGVAHLHTPPDEISGRVV